MALLGLLQLTHKAKLLFLKELQRKLASFFHAQFKTNPRSKNVHSQSNIKKLASCFHAQFLGSTRIPYDSKTWYIGHRLDSWLTMKSKR